MNAFKQRNRAVLRQSDPVTLALVMNTIKRFCPAGGEKEKTMPLCMIQESLMDNPIFPLAQANMAKGGFVIHIVAFTCFLASDHVIT